MFEADKCDNFILNVLSAIAPIWETLRLIPHAAIARQISFTVKSLKFEKFIGIFFVNILYLEYLTTYIHFNILILTSNGVVSIFYTG